MDVNLRVMASSTHRLLLGFAILFVHGPVAWGQFSGGAFQSRSSSTATNSSFPGGSSFQTPTQNDTPFAGRNTAKIQWIDGKNINQAFRLAMEQNKPVLLHFWNEQCRPCLALENYVFPNPILAQAINSQFIPVKVNTTQTPEIHRKYGVNRWPWDVFVAPNGAKLREGPSPNNASMYTQHINAVARMQRQFLNLASTQNPTGNSPDSTTPNPSAAQSITNQFGQTAGHTVPNSSMNKVGTAMQTQYQGSTQSQPTQNVPSSSMASPMTMPAASFKRQTGPTRVENKFFAQSENNQAKPSQLPSVGMEGFCPVSMLRETKKVKGSKDWGCIHRGRLYFFANQSYRQIFLQDPDRYAPVLAGYDVVLYRETGKLVEGKTEFGGFVGQDKNRVVFLFSSPETKRKFIEDKQGRYLETARVATRNTRENWLR